MGKLKLLATGSKQRSTRYPNVPTLAESGLPTFEVYTLFGVYAPAGTPEHIIERVKQSVDRAVMSKESKAATASLGATPVVMTRQAFEAHHPEEKNRYGSLIRKLNISLE